MAGCGILDTDEVSHNLQASGGEAVEAIADCFGVDVVTLGGAVKRKALAKKVFSEPAALKMLEAIMHPLIEKKVAHWIETRPEGSVNAVLVPLLFEAGYDRKFAWDAIVAVVCSPEVQMQRLLNRGLTEAEARERIAAQMPCETKAALADYVIDNNGGKDELQAQAEQMLAAVLRSSPNDN